MDIEDLHLVVNKNSESINNIINLCHVHNHNKPFKTVNEGLYIRHKIYVNTFGCSQNKSYSEYITGILAKEGYELIDEDIKYDADLWVLNDCTDKDPSELSFDKSINLSKNNGIKIVLVGCVSQGDSKKYKDYSIIGIPELERVGEAIEETLRGNIIKFVKRKVESGENSLLLPKIRKNKLIEIIPINTHCLNNCTYCKTKSALGGLTSYTEDGIIERINTRIDEGVVEIWLSSEDTRTYGIDINTNIVNLFKKIVSILPEHVMLRIGMINSLYILEHKEEIAKILNHPRVYEFIHIPIQSGSNKILEHMQRKYSREDFMTLVDYLINNVKNIHIATDVICGFPFEDDNDFKDTCDVITNYQFQTLNISQFFPRKGTLSAKMGQVNSFIKKKRTREISEIFGNYKNFEQFKGVIFKVLCTEVSHKNNYYIAHNKHYHQILIPQKEEYMGKILYVKITDCDKFYMIGDVINYDQDYKTGTYIAVFTFIILWFIIHLYI